jgi:hypothetical protein
MQDTTEKQDKLEMQDKLENQRPIEKMKQKDQNETTDICIPRMETIITRQTIYEVFKRINIGKIERIVENPLKTDPTHKRIIIKLRWYNTETANKIKTRIENNQPVNIVYEIPWFWRVVLSNK